MSGTVPIFYQGVQYNIPVDLFIPEKYPSEPPKIYVRPTPNMTIKSNHRHVDMQGLVFLPYLHEWKPDSNLTGLVEITSNVFSIEPPLFSKPAAASPAAAIQYPTYTPPTATATSSGAYGSTTSASHYPGAAAAATYGGSSTAYPTAAVAANPYGSGNYGTSSGGAVAAVAYGSPYSAVNGTPAVAAASSNPYAKPSYESYASPSSGGGYAAAAVTPSYASNGASAYGITPTSSVNTTAAVAQAEAQKAKEKRAKLIAEVTQRMREDLQISQEILRDELDAEFNTEKYLKESKETGEKNIAELKETVRALEVGLETIATKTVDLTAWAESEGSKAPLDGEQRLEPFDDLAAQVIKLNSELNSIDDCVYYLERGLVSDSNTTDLAAFLKETRRLARQQFLCKAHLMKINAQMVQQRQAVGAPVIANTNAAQYYAPQQAPQAPAPQPVLRYSPSLQAYQLQQPPAPAPAPQQFGYQPPNGQYLPPQQWPQAPTGIPQQPVAQQTQPTHSHKVRGPKLTVL
eukprot:gene26168-32703_t